MILLFLKNFLKGPFQGSFIGAEEKDQNVFVGLLLLLTPGKSLENFVKLFRQILKTLSSNGFVTFIGLARYR